MVGRTITQYMRAGVAALHLEDQVITKRCGHLMNKKLVSDEEFLSRIRAAVLARSQAPGDIVIIARTDALQSLGYEAARDRLKRAVDLGADVGFLEGVASSEQAKSICQDLFPTPVLFNNVAGGVSPEWSADEAGDLGFKLIVYPSFALGPVYKGVSEAAKHLKETGSMVALSGSPKEVFEVCGLKDAMDFDISAGGQNFSGGV